jgi:hypothetical protein
MPTSASVQQNLQAKTASFTRISGVTSVTAGYLGTLSKDQQNYTIKAVDAGTYAKTASWDVGDSTQSLSSLMQTLVAQRAKALQTHLVPALVDSITWQALQLHAGDIFTLQINLSVTPDQPYVATSIPFVAVAMVQHIPTLTDEITTTDNTMDPAAAIENAGILVDYQSAAAGYAHATPLPQILPVDYVWLRTRDDAATLTRVRSNLTKVIPTNYYLNDRRQLLSVLQNDPILLSLKGVLVLGTLTPLLLALVGSLLASWQSVRTRLLSFVLLRALGTGPRQLAGVVSWEQGLVWSLMFVLGLSAGVLLSAMVVPVLMITSIATINANGITFTSGLPFAQVFPSLTLALPTTLPLVLGGLLLVGVVAQALVVQVIVRESLGQSLRTSND